MYINRQYLEQLSDSLATSREIIRSIFEIIDTDNENKMMFIWNNPKDYKFQIIQHAFSLTDEDYLFWGDEKINRPTKEDEIKNDLIELIKSYNHRENNIIFIEESILDNWSDFNGLANEDYQYDLETLRKLLKDEYTVDPVQTSESGDFKLLFRGVTK